MNGELDLTTARDFAIALLIGALVGIEREKKKSLEGDTGIGGLRTFILLALAGAVSAWLTKQLASPWIFAATVLAVAALLLTGYVSNARLRPAALGLTTEVAAIVVCLLGGVTLLGHPEVAVGLGIVTSATLAYKQPLHGLVKKLGTDDIYAGLKLLIATFIVLPLLPNRTVDPWDALNPYKLWWLVILISGISLVGYVAVRWLGSEHGTALTGLAGGLVSSTAVTLSFARRSRDPHEPADAHALCTGILLAWCVMIARIAVLVAVVYPALLLSLAVPLAAMGIATIAFALVHYLQESKPEAKPGMQAEPVELKNPFSLWSASKFALFFAVVLLLVKLAQTYLPDGGLLAVAALAGVTDVDAIALSLSAHALDSGEMRVAALGIVIAALVNTLTKCGLILALGKKDLKWRILAATALVTASGLAGLLFV